MRIGKLAPTVLAVCCVMAGGTAMAHDLIQGPTIMHNQTNGKCVQNRTGISESLADIRAISKKHTTQHGQCSAHDAAPANDLKVKAEFQKSSQPGPVFNWDACHRTWGPVTNNVTTEVLWAKLYWSNSATRDLLCGDGWYRVKGYSWRWIEGAYRGGSHSSFSEAHWVDF